MTPQANTSCFEEDKLFECAELLLPWLSPSDLASVSLTCKTLYSLSKSITIQRSSDASRNLENFSIPFINNVDSQPYSYFIYTPSQILSSPTLSQVWGSNPNSNSFSSSSRFVPNPTSLLLSSNDGSSSGCLCKSCSDEDDGEMIECPCWGLDSESDMMTECGPGCTCGLECGNRPTQRGVSVKLRIVKDEKKGWSLYSAQFIHYGQFICEYAGELLTTQEAKKRQKRYDELASKGRFSSALLVVREHLPSGKACLRINIDATRVGNIARFISHSCDGGNLETALVRNSGALVPRLCFFAAKDIRDGEELSFSYGDGRLKQNGLRCFCGSSGCLGTLPSEQT